jgi:hypothetical protein
VIALSVWRLGYGLEDRGSRVRVPAGAGNFFLYRRIQNDSGAHPASYPTGTLRVKRPGREADLERFVLRQLDDVKVKEKYKVVSSNTFAAL